MLLSWVPANGFSVVAVFFFFLSLEFVSLLLHLCMGGDVWRGRKGLCRLCVLLQWLLWGSVALAAPVCWYRLGGGAYMCVPCLASIIHQVWGVWRVWINQTTRAYSWHQSHPWWSLFTLTTGKSNMSKMSEICLHKWSGLFCGLRPHQLICTGCCGNNKDMHIFYLSFSKIHPKTTQVHESRVHNLTEEIHMFNSAITAG